MLSRRIDETLAAVLPRGAACALIDYPNHANAGDSAIWLGERACLRRANVSVAYLCDMFTFSKTVIGSRLRDAVILIHGGGNLGDIWPGRQSWREEVIMAFPDRKIIQLPQTIHFRERRNLQRARAVFDGHPDLTILVRDRRSLELARNEFRAKSELCPDMAFALGVLPRVHPARDPIVCLARTDLESSGLARAKLACGVTRVDWARDPISTIFRTGSQWLFSECDRVKALRRFLPGLSWGFAQCGLFDHMARRNLGRGCGMLSRGNVVITDRLHGHILSLLLGIPHVLLDNTYGKLARFFETWTKECRLAFWAGNPDEAFQQARALAQYASTPSPRCGRGVG